MLNVPAASYPRIVKFVRYPVNLPMSFGIFHILDLGLTHAEATLFHAEKLFVKYSDAYFPMHVHNSARAVHVCICLHANQFVPVVVV